MTPEALNSLRADLPRFDQGASPSPALQEFLSFYHLDFTAGQPELSYRSGLIRSGQFELMTHRWLQPGATHNLLLLHGYFDHSGLYDKLVGYGLSRNCNVLIFDLPGHGLSSGEPARIIDFAHYSRAIADVLDAAALPGLPLIVLGQSTGCAALIEFARHYRWPFSRAALLAPLIRPTRWLGVRLGHGLLHRFRDSVERRFNRNSSDEDFLAFVAADPLQSRQVSMAWIGALKRWLASLVIADLGVGPVLVIQGQQDETVAWKYNVKAIEALFPGSEIVYLAEAGHQLANESTPLREEYFRRLDDYLFGGHSDDIRTGRTVHQGQPG